MVMMMDHIVLSDLCDICWVMLLSFLFLSSSAVHVTAVVAATTVWMWSVVYSVAEAVVCCCVTKRGYECHGEDDENDDGSER